MPTTTTTSRPLSVTVDRDLLRRAILAVAPAASTGDTVPVLEGIQLTYGDGALTVTATDRYRMHQVIVTATVGEHDQVLNTGDEPEGTVILPAKELARIVKAWKAPRNHYGDPLTAAIVPADDRRRAMIVDHDGSSTYLDAMEGQYPKHQTLWPDLPDLDDDGSAVPISVNPHYLADAVTCSSVAFGDSRKHVGPCVIYGRPQRDKPVTVVRGTFQTRQETTDYGRGRTVATGKPASDDGVLYRALVMPVRLAGK